MAEWTKQLIGRFDLNKDRNPQTYGVGIKELWEVPSGRIAKGHVHEELRDELFAPRKDDMKLPEWSDLNDVADELPIGDPP